MRNELTRRGFMGAVGATATAALANTGPPPDRELRVGIIGVGRRGTALLRLLLKFPGVRIPALCDIAPEALIQGTKLVTDTGQPAPETYGDGEEHYKTMLARGDLDAVLIATPWNWHTPMAVAAMGAGVYAGVEVPGAITLEECWDLIDTHEETGVHCMMLENWSFRRDNLALLNMKREGLFGDIVHGQCAYAHDCRYWFFNDDGSPRWTVDFLRSRNADQYPTHSQGPVLSWLDINCGDAYASLTSTATATHGLQDFLRNRFGPDHPLLKEDFKQADIVTTVVRTHRGKTLMIQGDMQLPRPYDNRWLLQGTKGIYSHEHDAVSFANGKNTHAWEPFQPWIARHDHPWWSTLEEAGTTTGHGGTDYLELKLFLEAVRHNAPPPLDLYDAATMCSIIPLSEQSIANNSAPVTCPDFTRGKWKTRQPYFGVL